jgi:hypothetical protein
VIEGFDNESDGKGQLHLIELHALVQELLGEPKTSGGSNPAFSNRPAGGMNPVEYELDTYEHHDANQPAGHF